LIRSDRPLILNSDRSYQENYLDNHLIGLIKKARNNEIKISLLYQHQKDACSPFDQNEIILNQIDYLSAIRQVKK
jgi:hypothetical protein